MNSYLNDEFLAYFQKLPEEIKYRARKNYQLWKINPYHPSLEFKRVHSRKLIYSARITREWRVLGVKDGDNIVWFWIGSHSEYDKLLKRI